jgi:hypothetical protein
MQAASDGTRTLLVYGQVDDYLVFIPRQRAIELAAVHSALQSAKTWGEFRAQVMPRDYEDALTWYADALSFEDFCAEESIDLARRAEAWSRYQQLSIGERPPLDGDEFKREHIPPFFDGDYPEWPAGSMRVWVPEHIQLTIGQVKDSNLNGDFLTFSPRKEQRAVAAFEAAGYSCCRDDDLTRRASGWA